jgi:hypothetical protein
MTLANYQFQFDSFVFGGSGSPYQILDVDGLEGLPGIRNQDDYKGANDGMFSGRDYLAARDLTFTMNIFADSVDTAHQNWALFKTALNYQQQGTTALRFLTSPTDSQKLINVRVRGRKASIDPEFTFGFIRAQVSMFAPDPRYYDDATQSLTLTPSLAVGRTYNRTYNLVYGGGSQTSIGTVTNTGWATTSPVITITGPAVNPTIGSVTQSSYITLNTILTATDTLVIDLGNKTVLLNDSSARNLVAAGSEWFDAPAGSSTFSFSASETTGGTSAVITWANAYI